MCNPPIFILSPERCGSTLCRYILDTHSAIASPGELALGELCASLVRVLTRVRSLHSSDSIAKEVRRLVDDIMGGYLADINKPVWCEKTPANLTFAGVLTEIFPDARYICLYRSFRDCAQSCIDVSRYGFVPTLHEYIRRHPGNLTFAMAENWVHKTNQLLTFEGDRRKQTIRVRYEDLVLNPESEVARILAFVGVPWEDIVERALSAPHHGEGGDYKIASERAIHSRSIGSGSDLPMHTIPSWMLEQINLALSTLGYHTL